MPCSVRPARAKTTPVHTAPTRVGCAPSSADLGHGAQGSSDGPQDSCTPQAEPGGWETAAAREKRESFSHLSEALPGVDTG